jgi:hypothetical protein
VHASLGERNRAPSSRPRGGPASNGARGASRTHERRDRATGSAEGDDPGTLDLVLLLPDTRCAAVESLNQLLAEAERLGGEGRLLTVAPDAELFRFRSSSSGR